MERCLEMQRRKLSALLLASTFLSGSGDGGPLSGVCPDVSGDLYLIQHSGDDIGVGEIEFGLSNDTWVGFVFGVTDPTCEIDLAGTFDPIECTLSGQTTFTTCFSMEIAGARIPFSDDNRNGSVGLRACRELC